MFWLLTLPFGGIVGFSLNLTGGGGAIFAVPLTMRRFSFKDIAKAFRMM